MPTRQPYQPMYPLIYPGAARRPQQMALPLPLEDEALLLRQARQLFDASDLLQARWASFDRAMADAVVGKALRTCAAGLLRSGARRAKKNRGR